MSNIIKPLANNWGGNTLNIIRVYSHNEHIKFILKDTLSGTIVAGSDRVWNHNTYAYTQLQNNSANNSFYVYCNRDDTNYDEKTYINNPVSFRPIFEYKE